MAREYRIVEDSSGYFRIQYRMMFIWWTVQHYHRLGGSSDRTYLRKEDALQDIKRLKRIANYKKIAKIHTGEDNG